MKQNFPASRIESIDGLRGAFAFAVMLYHLVSWTQLDVGPHALALLRKAGIYAVAGFFVVSGYSMYWAYAHRVRPGWVADYFWRRFMRIAPLFYLALLWLLWRQRRLENFGVPAALDPFWTLLLNFSLLFGLHGAGTTSYVTGGWSIGIEWVFYMLFPLMFLGSALHTRRWGMGMAVAVCAALTWSLYGVNESRPLGEQWGTFVSPLYYAVYFVAGAWLASLHRAGLPLERFAIPGMLLAVFVFVFTATHFGDQVEIVTGFTFVLLAGATIGLVAFAAHLPIDGGWVKSLCQMSGNASYALYLLHPLLFLHVMKWVDERLERVLTTIALAIPLSLIVYRYYERPFMRIRPPFKRSASS